MAKTAHLITHEMDLYQAFLNKLHLPSALMTRKISRQRGGWMWAFDNPFTNGEEGLAIAIAWERGITFPFLPQYVRKNAELGREEIKRRLLDHYHLLGHSAEAKRLRLMPRNFNAKQKLKAFAAAAARVAKRFDPKAELQAIRDAAAKSEPARMTRPKRAAGQVPRG